LLLIDDLDHLDKNHTMAVLVNDPGIYTRLGTLSAIRDFNTKTDLRTWQTAHLFG
jgi:hypothetical protein